MGQLFVKYQSHQAIFAAIYVAWIDDVTLGDQQVLRRNTMSFMDPEEWSSVPRARAAARSRGAQPGPRAARGQFPWNNPGPQQRSHTPRGRPWGQHGSATEAAVDRAARAAEEAARSPTEPPAHVPTTWPVVGPKGGLNPCQPARTPRAQAFFMQDTPDGQQLPHWVTTAELPALEAQQQAARAAARAARAAGGPPPPAPGQPSYGQMQPAPTAGNFTYVFNMQPPPAPWPAPPAAGQPCLDPATGQLSEPAAGQEPAADQPVDPGASAPPAGQPSEPAAGEPCSEPATGQPGEVIEVFSSDEEVVNMLPTNVAKIPKQ